MLVKHPLFPPSCLLWVPPELAHVLRLEEELNNYERKSLKPLAQKWGFLPDIFWTAEQILNRSYLESKVGC